MSDVAQLGRGPLADTGKKTGRDSSQLCRASRWDRHTCKGQAVQTELKAWFVSDKSKHHNPGSVLQSVQFAALRSNVFCLSSSWGDKRNLAQYSKEQIKSDELITAYIKGICASLNSPGFSIKII